MPPRRRRLNTSDPDSHGTLISELRLRKGWTQAQMASKLINTRRETLSRWESGKSLPPLEKLIEIACLTEATDAETVCLILLERGVQTRFPPPDVLLPQLERVAEQLASTPFPAYLLDYRGRFWAINAAVAQMIDEPLESLEALLQASRYDPIDFLDITFNSNLPFKRKLVNFEQIAHQQIAVFKMVNLYRRHEPFLQKFLQRAEKRFPREDFAYFKAVWQRIEEQNVHNVLERVYPEIVIETAAGRQHYFLHSDPIFQLGKDLFSMIWYRTADWSNRHPTPQKVLCLWHMVDDIVACFNGEWRPR